MADIASCTRYLPRAHNDRGSAASDPPRFQPVATAGTTTRTNGYV
jgi:hypothetical protein